MTHSTSGRSCQSRDKTHHRLVLGVIGFDPLAGIFLSISSDLSDHDNTLSFGVIHKPLQHIDKISAIERVSSDSYHGRLTEPSGGGLIHGLIGQSSRPRNNSNFPGLVNESGHNSNLTLIGLNDSGTIRTDHSGSSLTS